MDLLLDLDGTLTDPREGITRCIQHALERLGEDVPEQSELLDCIGPPLHESFQAMLGGDEDRARKGVALYRERFSDVGLYENSVYPGIPEALECLKARGCRLFLATSKPAVYAERIVRHFDLDHYLDGVFGSEMDGRRTDKRDLLAFVVKKTGCTVGRAMMIGDRRHDAIGARANGIRPVGVAWGYGSREELQSAGVVSILERPEELSHLHQSD